MIKTMATNKQYNSSAQTITRPWSVTLLALVVLSIATLNLVRCWQAFAQWSFLSEILPISPLYLALSGLFWGIMGLPLFWGMWKGIQWAHRIAQYAALAYSVYYWVDRLLVKADVANENLPFTIVANLLIVGLIVWNFARKNVVSYFGVPHD